MKSIIYTFLITIVLLLSSCSGWLDVNPQTEIKAEKLYEDEYGFQTALTGAYILMAEKPLYGETMSYYFPELMAQNWAYVQNGISEIDRLASFNFTTSNEQKDFIAKIWINYYKVIAQLNHILEFLEKSDVSFKYGNKDIIHGEVLGLRAFLHLEVYRLFAPHPTGNNLDEITIPYMTVLVNNVNELLSVEARVVIENIEKDLDKAEELLAESDPILKYTNAQLNSFLGDNRPADDWQMFRQSRFNYYAVLATKARFYQWIGNKEKAMANAQRVIDSEKFRLADNDYLTGSDGSLVMLRENIFNVANANLKDMVGPKFVAMNHPLKIIKERLDTAYELKAIGKDDIRYIPSRRFWMTSPNSKEEDVAEVKYLSCLKYYGSTEEEIRATNVIPLIRLSEMYFILMESKSFTEALPYVSDYWVARNLSSSIENDFTNESDRIARMEKEYRKEFYAEGQMFYFYKRHNYSEFTWPNTMKLPSTDVYTIPKPDGQLDFEFFNTKN